MREAFKLWERIEEESGTQLYMWVYEDTCVYNKFQVLLRGPMHFCCISVLCTQDYINPYFKG